MCRAKPISISVEVTAGCVKRPASVAVTSFALHRLRPFPRNDWHHYESRQWVSPPPTQSCTGDKADEQDSREIEAKVGLPCVRLHRSASKFGSDLSFGARQKGHNNERNARQDNSGNAVLRGLFLDD